MDLQRGLELIHTHQVVANMASLDYNMWFEWLCDNIIIATNGLCSMYLVDFLGLKYANQTMEMYT
jgi:hypothetical protein